MAKKCDCGQLMGIELRRLVYARRACICHVPVYACRSCSAYELLSVVKADLVEYVQSLGEVKNRIKVSFADICEPASVLRDALITSLDSIQDYRQRCKDAYEERINMLLDLYQFAKTQNDIQWISEIGKRLEKMNAFSKLTDEIFNTCPR